ncbi:prolyl 4-hydroxylase subunit alpha-1 isoform X2 [Drosophila kikkawai]|uniref:Prolyl 4-hydroxylase subunit alpha-1 isoform X2 n=1 Tax=Drosophila kikkawai TaxID=30033 RepID=A0A6P4I295_DROKI|nr:prolyl 4-hydroxylase subunit alpha-1 isoform X2 [Drosophila kikkawai]
MLSPIWSLLLLGTATVVATEVNYATSTRDIASLLQIEDELVGYMRQYVQELQHKINKMRKVQEEWKTRSEHVKTAAESYVANPLVSFPLMLRMHVDAKKWLELGREDIQKGPLQELVNRDLTGITDMDLQDATRGLLHLQDVYSLEERDVAKGKLNGIQFDSRLSAADCLAVGSHLDSLNDSKLACKWLNVSLEQYEEHMDPVYKIMETGRFHIWEKMGKTLLEMHDLNGSQSAFKKLLEWASKEDDTWLVNHLLDNLRYIAVNVDNCRGKNIVPVKSVLRCRYLTEGSPFLRLAPFKLEQLSLEPFVGLYHDVISSAEREDLINLTQSRLENRGTHLNFVEAAVENNASGYVESLHRRIEDMTGLELGESEPLMVYNFGTLGQHFIHLDCQTPENFVEPFPKEYRSATVLLYLTEVQVGGYASFPALGFGFKPTRGSALVWHNIDSSGNCDSRSLQATCPVILGTQWVATKWISGSGQWRRKPCRK